MCCYLDIGVVIASWGPGAEGGGVLEGACQFTPNKFCLVTVGTPADHPASLKSTFSWGLRGKCCITTRHPRADELPKKRMNMRHCTKCLLCVARQEALQHRGESFGNHLIAATSLLRFWTLLAFLPEFGQTWPEIFS